MTDVTESNYRRFSSRDALMLGGGVLVALVALAVWTMWTRGSATPTDTEQPMTSTSQVASPDELKVSREILAAAGVESVPVTAKALVRRVQTTGVVEPNQQQIQQVTPLVGGRIERVPVVLGDLVPAGNVLLTLSSPQIAELQGNLKTAEANQVQADATLTRTKRLVELGAGAGKDLVAAEAAFQTAQAQVAQLQQSLRALGESTTATTDAGAPTSTIAIRAPMTGTVIERAVNPGAWIEAGKPVFTIANLTTVWVIVSVPEASLGLIQRGARVEIRAPTLGGAVLIGSVSYIDPQLAQQTRTARVRVEVPNAGQPLKIGMFVDVIVEGPIETGATALTVPTAAVQRIGDRTVVFVLTDDAERFHVRDVELGDEAQNARVILNGVTVGERVVTTGAFTLKSQLLKGQFGEDEALTEKAR